MASLSIPNKNRPGYLQEKHGRRQAWNAAALLRQTIEKQSKLNQEAWREVEVVMRSTLREALRHSGTGKERKPNATPREIKDLALAAGICQSKAYPESSTTGLSAHAPAHLLKAVADIILKTTPQPVDITPEPPASETIPTVALCDSESAKA